jgi:hypothetical protein
MVMSFHKYWDPNTEGSIARFLALREQYGVPIRLGENVKADKGRVNADVAQSLNPNEKAAAQRAARN